MITAKTLSNESSSSLGNTIVSALPEYCIELNFTVNHELAAEREGSTVQKIHHRIGNARTDAQKMHATHLSPTTRVSIGRQRRNETVLEFLIEGIFIFVNEMLLAMKGNDCSNMFDRLCGMLEDKDAQFQLAICRKTNTYFSALFGE